jgi:hypothetical protein
MRFLNDLSARLNRWMSGRNGTDQLGIFTLIFGLILSMLGSILNLGIISFLGLVLYVITLFRMFSRNLQGRRKENDLYLKYTGNLTTKSRQFFRRMKNRKEYRYFRCPQCRQLIRMKRGTGEKQVTCAKCGHQFQQKA